MDVSNPSNGQTLVYNATSGKWENGAGGGGVRVIDGIFSAENNLVSTTITVAELLEAYLSCDVAIRWTVSVEGPSGSLDINEYALLYAVEDAGDIGCIFYASGSQSKLRSPLTLPSNMVSFDLESI